MNRARFVVFIDDNARYGDESARFRLGEFDSYEEAVAAVRQRLDAWLDEQAAAGTTGLELFRVWSLFGEDLFVVGPGHFSAADYVRERTREPNR